MAEEKISGKWAAEAYDFIRLFQRDGKRITGLLFIEIAWALYVALVMKLLVSSNEIVVPQFHFFQKCIGPLELSVAGIYFSGTGMIFAFWIWHSELYKYIFIPIITIIKPLLIACGIAAFLVVLVFDLPINLVNKLLQKKGDANNQNEIWTLRSSLAPFLRTFLMRVFSYGKVGLSPIVGYSYDEDYRAAKLPLQMFASAVELCRLKLQDSGLSELLVFRYLPPSAKIVSASRARFARVWFGFDVLLWGSFSGSAGSELWVNFSRKSMRKEISERAQQRNKKIEINYFSEQQLIFDRSLGFDFTALSIAENEPVDAYIAIAAAIVQVVTYRRELPGYFSILDRLKLFTESSVLLPLKLFQSCFANLPEMPLPESNPPGAKVILVEFMGRWARLQLADQFSLATNSEKRDLIATAHRIQRRCVQLLPQRVENKYGLGAFECFLGSEVDAETILRQAGELDANANVADPIMASVYADEELRNAETFRDRDRALARFAAYATRTIYIGDDFIRQSLWGKMRESFVVTQHRDGSEKSKAIAIVDKLFNERGYSLAS